jgi:hypothetical protein
MNVIMPANCGACGIELHKATEVVKCAGKCGLNYHSICTDLRTQQDIEMLVNGKTHWVCNFCRTYGCNKTVENVNDTSRLYSKIEPKVSDQVRSITDEFFEVRIRVEELLSSLDNLEIGVNNINKTECKDSRRVIKGLETYHKGPNNYSNNLTLKISGLPKSQGSFNVGKPNGQLSRDGHNIIILLEHIEKSLKLHMYLLAAITLIFVICKICGR